MPAAARPSRLHLCAALCWVLMSSLAAAQPSAEMQRLLDDSFAALERGDAEHDEARKLAAYKAATARAEEAVQLADTRAEAHYALFCALGRLTELRGPIGRALMLPRVRRELERTLALDPQHSEALAAKGEMLLRLPRWLGGNLKAAETYLRRSLVYDPTYWRAHILLARTLVAQSRPRAAREALQQMLAIVGPQRHERAEALALLAELETSPES